MKAKSERLSGSRSADDLELSNHINQANFAIEGVPEGEQYIYLEHGRQARNHIHIFDRHYRRAQDIHVLGISPDL